MIEDRQVFSSGKLNIPETNNGEDAFLNFIKIFLLFHNYLPLEKGEQT